MSNVLLIDDDKYFTDDISEFIEDAGHSCVVINKSDDLIELFNNLDIFDTIILDIMMRKPAQSDIDFSKYSETGETFYNIIRNRFNKKIIIVSAKNKDDLSIDISNDANTLFVPKPTSSTAQEIIDKL